MWSGLQSLGGVCLPASRIPEASGSRASRRSAESQAPMVMTPPLPLRAPVPAAIRALSVCSHPPAGSWGGAVPSSFHEESGSARRRKLPEGQLVITRTPVPLISELQVLSRVSSHLQVRSSPCPGPESPELNPWALWSLSVPT